MLLISPLLVLLHLLLATATTAAPAHCNSSTRLRTHDSKGFHSAFAKSMDDMQNSTALVFNSITALTLALADIYYVNQTTANFCQGIGLKLAISLLKQRHAMQAHVKEIGNALSALRSCLLLAKTQADGLASVFDVDEVPASLSDIHSLTPKDPFVEVLHPSAPFKEIWALGLLIAPNLECSLHRAVDVLKDMFDLLVIEMLSLHEDSHTLCDSYLDQLDCVSHVGGKAFEAHVKRNGAIISMRRSY